MAYNVRALPSFENSLSRIDKNIAKRILEKIDVLAENPQTIPRPMGNLPKNLSSLCKTRVGDWRVFFWVDHNAKEIILYFVSHRDDIYKWLYRRK